MEKKVLAAGKSQEEEAQREEVQREETAREDRAAGALLYSERKNVVFAEIKS